MAERPDDAFASLSQGSFAASSQNTRARRSELSTGSVRPEFGTSTSLETMRPNTRSNRENNLVRTIESQVIPRLMLSITGRTGPARNNLPPMPEMPDHVSEFAGLVLARDDSRAQRHIDRLRMAGTSLDAIYLELLAPAARRLGELWVDDAVDFSDVTVGLGRIHKVVRRLSPEFRPPASAPQQARPATLRRALIAPVHNEQHTLGCVMIEDYLARDGWDVLGWPLSTDVDLVERVRTNYYDMVGLSVSCETSLPALSNEIDALRRASRNRSIFVMVGGRVFTEDPVKARLAGADATAGNAHDAVCVARAWVEQCSAP